MKLEAGAAKNFDSRKLVSCFILFHIISLLFAAISPKFMYKYNPISSAYVHAFGLYQNWSMFERAPSGNFYLIFLVKFNNGKTDYIEFAHMDKLDLLSRLQLHRFRKFQQSSVFNPANRYLWPDLCRWVYLGYPPESRKIIESVTLAEGIVPFAELQKNDDSKRNKLLILFQLTPNQIEEK